MRFIRLLAIWAVLYSPAWATITRTARLAESSKTTASSWTTTGTVTAASGDTLIVGVVARSNAANSAVWNTGTSQTLSSSAALAGVTLFWLDNVTGGTATLTIGFTAADSAHALFATSLTGGNGALADCTNATNSGSGTSVTTPSITCAPNSGAQAAWIGAVGAVGPSGDGAPTWTVPTTAGQRAGTTGGSQTSNATVNEGFELDSSSMTQGMSMTLAVSRSWGAVLVTWKEPAGGGTAMKDPLPLRGIVPFPR